MKSSKPTLAALLIAVVTGVVHSVSATAIPIQFEQLAYKGQVLPGPTGVVDFVSGTFTGLSGTPFQGQNLSLDFTFPNGEFMRLFTETLKPNVQSFVIDIAPRINNDPQSVVFSGIGYMVDSHGNALSAPRSLETFPETNGVGQLISEDLVLRGFQFSNPPIDFYGIHLDLTLPVSPGFGFQAGGVGFNGGIFGVGPGIPTDMVPETGGTFGLLTLAFATLLAIRWLYTGMKRLDYV